MDTSDLQRGYLIAISVFLGPLLLLEVFRRRFLHPLARWRDVVTELATGVMIVLGVYPLVLLTTTFVLRTFWPGLENGLLWMPWWMGFVLFMIGDDLVQYWWHRQCHQRRLLFNLHRLHHSAPYMGLRMAYRDNPFFHVLLPNAWISAGLLYAGLVYPYFIYMSVKMIVAVSAHSSIPWDEKLYANRFTLPFMWIIERTISTPATHAAHHGLSARDGVTHYNGNYAVVFFFWDVLFGTAKITRRRPPAYGVENMAAVPWMQDVLWPLYRRRPEIAVDARTETTT